MKRSTVAAVFASTALALASGTAAAQGGFDFGKAEYYSNCAVCHGLTGKGEGSFGEVLKGNMPDLTVLAKRSGGVLPVDRVMMTIDGRATPRAHGTSEMPIWGDDYTAKATHYLRNDPQYSPTQVESFVRMRILAVVDYLNRLQVK